MITASSIIILARDALGTPYLDQGRQAGLGLDCVGVPIYIAKELGLSYIDSDDYGRVPVRGELERMLLLQPCLMRVHDRQPGDLLVMKFTDAPQHVGVFTGETVIHSYESVGRVVEHHLDSAWLKRIVYVFRFKDE